MNSRGGFVPSQSAHAYDAQALRVAIGANLHDPIAESSLCELGDVYRLDADARMYKLTLLPEVSDGGFQRVAEGSEIGEPGDSIELQSVLTLIAPDGETVEVLYVRHGAAGRGFAIPLSPMAPRTDYALINASDDIGDVHITDIVCVSFAAGTMITLPSGLQRPIDKLKTGEKVLTRDHGGQEIRWIGKATMRARGAFAPVVISAGTLGNLGDLAVSPHHRVFVYQQGDDRLGDTAALFIQAKHLIDGNRVTRREGGFVDYYFLIFDRHEVIYAEGIPSESLMINDATISNLPPEIARAVDAHLPGLRHAPHFGTEIGAELLDEKARRRLFRRSDSF
ncbi:MAG: Hint domain-containing protein [Rhodobacteraceae bacterium]|nr:Hint domain-containing protein [Paracoccaceae bacterium]